MAPILRHLSVSVKDPKQSAEALAEMTGGRALPFIPLKGAYACLWPDWEGEFVEFYPKDVGIVPTARGGDFKTLAASSEFSSTHINVRSHLTGDEVKAIADRYGFKHHFRPGGGGPLYEVWIENTLLIEIVTRDLAR